MAVYTFEVTNPVMRSIRDQEPSDFIFEIESFLALLKSCATTKRDRIEWPVFTAGDHKWVMVIYPNGNREDNGAGHISLYLRLFDGYSVNASFKFFILDQERETYVTIHDGKKRKFDAGHLEWGISQALPVAAFNNARNGLLVNGSCTFGAEVYVIKNTATFASLSSLVEKQTFYLTGDEQTFISGSYFRRVYDFPCLAVNKINCPIGFHVKRPCVYKKLLLCGRSDWTTLRRRGITLALIREPSKDEIDDSKLYIDCVLSITDQFTGGNHKESVRAWFDSEHMSSRSFTTSFQLTKQRRPLKEYIANEELIIEGTINEMLLVREIS
ncbi:hypothetical protein Ancab_010953 [Ancistrocladus abbreviatus]